MDFQNEKKFRHMYTNKAKQSNSIQISLKLVELKYYAPHSVKTMLINIILHVVKVKMNWHLVTLLHLIKAPQIQLLYAENFIVCAI